MKMRAVGRVGRGNKNTNAENRSSHKDYSDIDVIHHYHFKYEGSICTNSKTKKATLNKYICTCFTLFIKTKYQ
jgi:hypothetical protein